MNKLPQMRKLLTMFHIFRKNLFSFVLLTLLLGLISVFDLFGFIDEWIMKREVLVSATIIVLGWLVTSKIGRDIERFKFVTDKKFQVSEVLLNSLTEYNLKVNKVMNELYKRHGEISLSFKIRDFTNLSSELMDLWQQSSQEYIRLMTVYTNYKVVLSNLEPNVKELDKLNDELNDLFLDKLVFTQVDFSKTFDSGDNKRRTQEVLDVLTESVSHYKEYLRKLNETIQKKLIGDVFKN